MALSIDEIGFGGLKLKQDDGAYRYGVDAVLLADFTRCGPSDRVMDLGTDTGVVPLILLAKYGPESVVGLEIRPDAAALARGNAELNGMQDRFSAVQGDVKAVKELFPCGSFSVVCSNPPYFEEGRGLKCSDGARQTARSESSAKLADFMEAAAWLLPKGGSFYLVHRPSRLVDILSEGRAAGLEAKELRMVLPHSGEAANLVLIRFVKGGGRELRILPDLVVRQADGSYTEEMRTIYGQ